MWAARSLYRRVNLWLGKSVFMSQSLLLVSLVNVDTLSIHADTGTVRCNIAEVLVPGPQGSCMADLGGFKPELFHAG